MTLLAAGTAALTRVAYLADPTDVGDEKDKAGPLAILIVIVLCVACFFLFRSMSKHLRRVRDDFPGADGGATPPTASGTTTATTGPVLHDADPVVITDASPPATPGHAPPADRETPSDTRSV